jgi:hypothetical protein
VKGAVAIATLLALYPLAARAAAEEPAAIEIVLVGTARSCDLLQAAVAPLLADQEPIVWRRENQTTVADARLPQNPGIWIEAAGHGRVRIVAFAGTDPPSERVVEAAQLSPVAAETVAQIVRETAEALRVAPATEADRPASPVQAAVVATVPAPPQPRMQYRRAFLGVGYVRRAVFASTPGNPSDHDEQGIHAAGFFFFDPGRASRLLSIVVDRAQLTAATYAGSNVATPQLDITHWSARALIGIGWRSQSGAFAGIGVGLGVDRLAASAGVTGGMSRWVLGSRGSLELGLPIPRSRIEIVGTVFVDIKPRVFFVETLSPSNGVGGPGPFPLFSTNRVEPGLTIGLAWGR